MEATLEKLCEIKGLSRITQQDEETFRKRTQEQRSKGNKDFKDSWAYIIQASRGLPYKIENQEGFLLLGAKEDKSAIVIPNYFATNEGIERIAQEIREKTGLPVILKNIDPKDTTDLEKKGFRRYLASEEWSAQSPYDDQTFPEQVIDIEELIRLRGSDYDCLRQELTKFSKKNPILSVKDYSSSENREEIERICREKEKSIQGFTEAHTPFLEMSHSEKRLQIILESEKRTAAFLLLDEISRECVAFNAIIVNNTMPNATTAAIYRGAALAAAKGYRYFNFQGSETESLDRWKRKFNPSQSIEKIHLIYKSN